MMERRKNLPYANDERIVELIPHIKTAVRFAFRVNHHQAGLDDLDDWCQRILVLLIEDDYRRLESFNSEKAGVETWLKAVVLHYVKRHLRNGIRFEPLDEPDYCSPAQSQEQALLEAEHHRYLQTALERLTTREKQLYECLKEDHLSPEEIARRLGIRTASVYRSKHKLIQKIRALLQDYSCE